MKELVENIVEWYKLLGNAILGSILVITSPLWILPYMILKNKGGAE